MFIFAVDNQEIIEMSGSIGMTYIEDAQKCEDKGDYVLAARLYLASWLEYQTADNPIGLYYSTNGGDDCLDGYDYCVNQLGRLRRWKFRREFASGGRDYDAWTNRNYKKIRRLERWRKSGLWKLWKTVKSRLDPRTYQ